MPEEASADSWVNSLHAIEVPLVVAAQAATPQWLEDALGTYTEWIHPTSAFTVVGPLLFALMKQSLATQMLLVFGIADLVNLVLKWLLAGDRPYWASQDVRQFPMTCEGGYGMPSGHVQAFTTVTYFCLARVRAARAAFAGHAALVSVGAYSRVYTGAHFPSQTVVAWVVGAMFGLGGHELLATARAGSWLGARAPQRRRLAALAGITGLSVTLVLGIFVAVRLSGRDPLASLVRADAACRSARGVIGLVWETAARVWGMLLGLTAAAAVLPWTDDVLLELKGSHSRWRLVLAVAAVILHSQCLGVVTEVAKHARDGPDGPASVVISAFLGFAGVAFAAPLGMLVSLLVRALALDGAADKLR